MSSALLSLAYACKPTASKQEITETPQEQHSYYLTIGTYNVNAKADTSIWIYLFDSNDGSFKKLSGFTGINNPSYMAWSNDNHYLYAVSENGPKESRLNALSFDNVTANFTLLNSEPTAGADPCFVSVAPDGRFAVTADYSGGSVSVFPILADGKLGACSQSFRYIGAGHNPSRQEAPHLHTVRFTPDSTLMLATDLGLDRVYTYNIDKNDSAFLVPDTAATLQMPAGSGPRHIAFAPNSPYLYIINELSGNVSVIKNENNRMTIVQEVEADTLHAGGSADIHITPDGKFLYATNRLQGDGIAIFRIGTDGLLTKVGYQPTGRHPRNFVISPNGKYLLLASRDDNRVEIYTINPTDGQLTLQPQTIQIESPVCLLLNSFNFPPQ